MIRKHLPDGTPYDVLEAGDPVRPDHDVEACGKCQFVGHRDFIVFSEAQRLAATMTFGRRILTLLRLYNPEHTIVNLGLYTLPGWNGHNAFWLFSCPWCEALTADYLHGWRLYLKCGSCGEHTTVEGDRFYEAEGRPKPPSRWETLRQLRRARSELTRSGPF